MKLHCLSGTEAESRKREAGGTISRVNHFDVHVYAVRYSAKSDSRIAASESEESSIPGIFNATLQRP